MALLLLDVGNTRLKWALYADPQQSDLQQLRPHSPISLAPATPTPLAHGAEFLEQIDNLAERASWAEHAVPTRILGCHVAGDAIRRKVEHQCELWQANPQWIVPQREQAGVINHYDNPIRLGADRWVALIAARQRVVQQWGLSQAKPVVVVMVGTAVTVDALDTQGHFLGGYILPGHGIMLRALQSGTAGLHVPTGEVLAFPRNTSDALTSGGTFAIAGAIDYMLRHLQQQSGMQPLCLLVGGAAWKIAPHMQDCVFELCENLIFEGLLHLANHPN